MLIFTIPGIAFETYAASASATALFIGGWVNQLQAPMVYVVSAATFIALYLVVALMSYPFVQRSVVRAICAGGIIGAALPAFIVIRSVIHIPSWRLRTRAWALVDQTARANRDIAVTALGWDKCTSITT